MSNAIPPELDFGVDLEKVRARLLTLSYFLSITNIQGALDAIEENTTPSPAAFVSMASEVATPNKIMGGSPGGAGSQRQIVSFTISVLFSEIAGDRSRAAVDRVEMTRKAVILILNGWTGWAVDNAAPTAKALQYDRYAVRAMSGGHIYGEVLMKAQYFLSI